MSHHQDVQLAQMKAFFENWLSQSTFRVRDCFRIIAQCPSLDVPGYGQISPQSDICSSCVHSVAASCQSKDPSVRAHNSLPRGHQCDVCGCALVAPATYDWIERHPEFERPSFIPHAHHVATMIQVLKKPDFTSASLDTLLKICASWKDKLQTHDLT